MIAIRPIRHAPKSNAQCQDGKCYAIRMRRGGDLARAEGARAVLSRLASKERPTDRERARMRAALASYAAALRHHADLVDLARSGPDPERGIDHALAAPAEHAAALSRLAADLAPNGRS